MKLQLTRRFGRLPRWAIQRLDTAAMEQLDAWLEGIFDAQSLEDLLGPKPKKARSRQRTETLKRSSPCGYLAMTKESSLVRSA